MAKKFQICASEGLPGVRNSHGLKFAMNCRATNVSGAVFGILLDVAFLTVYGRFLSMRPCSRQVQSE
jgi:hypothetical protein